MMANKKEDTTDCAAEVKVPVDLPQSVVDFYNKMTSLNLLECVSIKIDDYPPDVQKIIKYAGTALENGRPLNKVMIVMAGQSGAGKSTTINSLFNDKVCSISACSSETREVTEYGKKLCVTLESPPVNGILSFVDIPGSLDVEQSKEALNLATINKFRKKHGDLADRSGFFDTKYKIKKQVHPNIVLMIVRANDNRMVGSDSNLMKSLKVLDECNLIDKNRNNLIVVVTHALSLGLAAKPYKEKSAVLIDHIREAVANIIHIRNVKIVFVENSAEDFNIKKEEGSDFYRLSDGQLSHYNLIQAIVEHFKQHDDYLGRLLCGWYFGDDCPEKCNKPHVLHSVQHAKLSEDETKEAQKKLGCLKIGMEEITEDAEAFPPFPFQFLGRGYCPKTESTKNVNVYSGTVNRKTTILGKQCTIPKCLQVAPTNEQYFHRLSCETREMYEQSRGACYGLDADVKLVVNVDSRGRWVKGNTATKDRSIVSILHETRLVNVRLDEPENNMKDQLSCDLDKLPTEFNKETANNFNEFFSKWGSHFICEVWVGGCIKVDYSVQASTFNDETSIKLMSRFRSTFRGKAHFDANTSDTSAKVEDFQDEQLTVSGGAPPYATSLKELAPHIKSWINTIKDSPTEFRHSFKLCPYYNLVDGKCKTSLRNATLSYLNDTITGNLSITRNDASKQIVSEVAGEEVKKSCFPPSATVATKDGLVAFKDLKPGAKILTVNCACRFELGLETCTCDFTEMYAYIHYDSEMVASYFIFHLENGTFLTVTGDHLVFSYNNEKAEAIRAKKLKIGDNLICSSDVICSSQNVKPVRIIEISHSTIKGVYSPLTCNGTLLVDGTLVSCYANIDSHAIAHASLAPLRWWYMIRKAVSTGFNYLHGNLQRGVTRSMNVLPHVKPMHHSSSGIHEYATFLLLVRKLLPFKLLQD